MASGFMLGWGCLRELGQLDGGILSYGGDNYEDDMQKALRLSILDGQRSGKIHAYMELVCVFFCVYIYFY